VYYIQILILYSKRLLIVVQTGLAAKKE